MQQRGELPVWWRERVGTFVLLTAALLAACNGNIGNNGGGTGGAATGGAVAYGPTGLHRLSRIEYDNTLADLLGDNTRPGFASLPEDVNDPFDNDFSTQQVSGALIAAAETLAAGASARLLADTTRRNALLGCTPSGAGDTACLTQFVRAFGRAFRRPLTDEDVAAYVGLSSFAVEANDFYVGVDSVLRAFLQDLGFPLSRGDGNRGRGHQVQVHRDRHGPERRAAGRREARAARTTLPAPTPCILHTWHCSHVHSHRPLSAARRFRAMSPWDSEHSP